jgi:hypothetical protein
MAFLHAKVFGGRLWPVAIASFGVYYLGSSFAAWLSGTLCSPGILRVGTDLLDFTLALRALARVIPPRNGDFVPLVSDFAHFNFSALICIFALPLGYKFVQVIPTEFERFFAKGAPEVDPAWVSRFFDLLQSSASRRWHQLLAAMFGMLSGLTFVVLARSGSAEAGRWWGHATFGFAGYYLAGAQCLCCYYALWGFQVLLIVNGHIQQAAERVQRFHAFHPDGYYGLQPLARLVLWEAGLILLAGIAIFSTYYLGYFGLEKTFLLLVTLLIFTVGTGAILAWPVWVLTTHVRRLRTEAIEAIEPQMQNMLDRLRRGETARPDRELKDDLAAMIRLHDTLKTSRTMPFGFASFNTVVLGYAIQAVILVRGFYGRFR